MNIINHYRDKIENILLKEFNLEKIDLKNISLEFPKDTSLGDLSTNASMVLSGKAKKTSSRNCIKNYKFNRKQS